MRCTRQALEKPLMVLPVDETAETIFDRARLIGIAREALNPPPDLKTLKVSIGLQRGASDSPALWSISFVDEKGYPKGQVALDSMRGAVSKMPR
jgi:hypothetical protein